MEPNSSPEDVFDHSWSELLNEDRDSELPSSLDPMTRAIVRYLAERPSEEEIAAAQSRVWQRLTSRQAEVEIPHSADDNMHRVIAFPSPITKPPVTPRARHWKATTRYAGAIGLATLLLLTLTGVSTAFILDGASWRTLFGPSAPKYDWPISRGSAARTGAANLPGIAAVPSLDWTFDAGDQVAAPPIVGQELIYLATTDVIALDKTTGTEKWRFLTGGNIDGLVLAKGRLFATSSDGNLYALDPDDGRELWRSAVNASRGASMVAEGDTVYIATSDGDLLALSADTAREKWRATITVGPDVLASVSLGHDAITVAVRNEGITAIERSTGRTRWRALITSDYGIAIDPPTIAHGMVYVTYRDKIGNAPEGTLIAYRLEDGAPVWTFIVPESHGIIAPVAVTADAVLAAGADRILRALDPRTGAVLWSRAIDSLVLEPLTASKDVVYAVGSDRMLRGFALDDGKEFWSLKITNGNLAGGVVIAGDSLVGATPDGALVAFGAADP